MQALVPRRAQGSLPSPARGGDAVRSHPCAAPQRSNARARKHGSRRRDRQRGGTLDSSTHVILTVAFSIFFDSRSLMDSSQRTRAGGRGAPSGGTILCRLALRAPRLPRDLSRHLLRVAALAREARPRGAGSGPAARRCVRAAAAAAHQAPGARARGMLALATRLHLERCALRDGVGAGGEGARERDNRSEQQQLRGLARSEHARGRTARSTVSMAWRGAYSANSTFSPKSERKSASASRCDHFLQSFSRSGRRPEPPPPPPVSARNAASPPPPPPAKHAYARATSLKSSALPPQSGCVSSARL